MNIKTWFQPKKAKRMNATTRRVSIPIPEDYDADEPNVRLSRAFLVVMLLHVVAVGGIFAFSTLKKNSASIAPEPIVSDTAPQQAAALSDRRVFTVGKSDTISSIAAAYGITSDEVVAANHLKESQALQPGDKIVIPEKTNDGPLPLDLQKLLQSSKGKNIKTITNTLISSKGNLISKEVTSTTGDEKYYIVQKGDNPVVIAKRQKVKYADLINANKITDPRKLKIGQKLIIPQK